MANWKITATTIYCDAVDCEVTLMVYKDWTVKCTGFTNYGNSSHKSQQSKPPLECKGLECSRVKEYKEKLIREETDKLNESQLKG